MEGIERVMLAKLLKHTTSMSLFINGLFLAPFVQQHARVSGVLSVICFCASALHQCILAIHVRQAQCLAVVRQPECSCTSLTVSHGA